ncbi:MAG: hypothetical protein ROW48_11990 [Bellilinea sp.]|jgi:hypothetical protein
MSPGEEKDNVVLADETKKVESAPVSPIVLVLDEETIQILLDDQIATGG